MCEPTAVDSTLGLVFTSRLPTRVDISDSVLVSDHRETVATVTLPRRRAPLLTRRSALNYKRADFDSTALCGPLCASRLKEAAFRRLRRNPSEETRPEFAAVSWMKLKAVTGDIYSQYLHGLTVHFKTNPKRYRSFFKCVKY